MQACGAPQATDGKNVTMTPSPDPGLFPTGFRTLRCFHGGGEQSCNAPYSLGCEFVLGSVNKVYSGIKQAPQKHRARNQTDTKQEGVLSHFVILHRGP